MGDQAVILAGGRGRRLRPFTDKRPKALVAVNGTPILAHQIHWLAEGGVDEVVIAAGYRGDAIVEYVSSVALPLRVQVLVENKPMGRGGALKLAAARLPVSTEPWCAVYGDIWTRFPLRALLALHRSHGLAATLALARSPHPHRAVTVDTRGRVTGFLPSTPPPYWVNAGVYVFSPCFAALLPSQGDHDDTIRGLVAAGQVVGHPIGAYWRAINTPTDLELVCAELGGQAVDTG